MGTWLIAATLLLAVGDARPKQQPQTRKQQQEARQAPAPTIAPESQPTAKIKENGPQKEPEQREDGFGPLTWPNWAVVIVGALGVFFAIRTLKAIRNQADIMLRQTEATETAAHAARKSAEVAEMALKLSERAEVLLEGAGLDTSPEVFTHSQAYFEFKNFGRTSATNVVLAVTLKSPEMEDVETKPATIIIGAGGSQVVSFPPFNEFVLHPMLKEIFAGSRPMTFHARVTYDDIFGGSHSMEYTGGFDASQGGRFKIT